MSVRADAAPAGSDTGPYTSAMTDRAARIHVNLAARGYDILVDAGLLARTDSFDGLAAAGTAVIVTNQTVGPLYGEALRAALEHRFSRVLRVDLPDGEAHKDWPALNQIFDALLTAGCDRKTTLFALGGGVVGDITGFAAACYMRGVAYVQVPTTLLAQVDSSVGGKTAINHRLGKNMIGAFHQPLRVLADLDTLATLPRREYVAGLAEVIKYGAVIDALFLAWIDTHLDALLARESAALVYAVQRSCEIKAAIVVADEFESGRRALLNFGHTFGHAIEAGLGYGAWLHGEAVACGMVLAARLSQALHLIGGERANRIEAVVVRAGLPHRPPPVSTSALLESMRVDKKVVGQEKRFVLLEGETGAIVVPVADAVVAGVIDQARAC